MHILPEVSSDYAEYMAKDDDENSQWLRKEEEGDYFPLPFALTFIGYTVILLVDKVIFDTHKLVGATHGGHTHDPAQEKLVGNVRASFKNYQNLNDSDEDNLLHNKN